MKTVDLTGLRVIAMRDVEAAVQQGATELAIREKAIVTPSAQDIVQSRGLTLRRTGTATPAASAFPIQAGNEELVRLFTSPEAKAVKAEIIAVGKKLWQRMYVDGNGGNISYRIGPDAVICTPTLCSKADLRAEDLCLVDLNGKQLLGGRARTSEILLHLEIYKAVPEAKAAVHCHPPHATAYAITGRVPPTCVIPEYEVFVGRAALSPYETPGTQKFAETVIPFVKNHNTVLLANHGVICWADTVTHAEWYVEVLDTYCWTLMLAAQIGPLSYITPEQTGDLLDIKKKLGLPDARHDAAPDDSRECRLCDMPDDPRGISVAPRSCPTPAPAAAAVDMETIVKDVTDAVMAALAASGLA